MDPRAAKIALDDNSQMCPMPHFHGDLGKMTFSLAEGLFQWANDLMVGGKASLISALLKTLWTDNYKNTI